MGGHAFHLLPLIIVISPSSLRCVQKETLPNTRLSVENLALNSTGSTLDEVVRLSQMMPVLKELHLCGNGQ